MKQIDRLAPQQRVDEARGFASSQSRKSQSTMLILVTVLLIYALWTENEKVINLGLIYYIYKVLRHLLAAIWYRMLSRSVIARQECWEAYSNECKKLSAISFMEFIAELLLGVITVVGFLISV